MFVFSASAKCYSIEQFISVFILFFSALTQLLFVFLFLFFILVAIALAAGHRWKRRHNVSVPHLFFFIKVVDLN